MTLRPGSEWLEAVIRAGTLGFGGPPHGSPERWDWGVTISTLATAQQQHERLARIASEMGDEQRAALWGDASPVAEQLRRLRG